MASEVKGQDTYKEHFIIVNDKKYISTSKFRELLTRDGYYLQLRVLSEMIDQKLVEIDGDIDVEEFARRCGMEMIRRT